MFFILPLTLTRLIWSFFFLTAGGLPGVTKRTFDGRVEETASAEWLPGGFFSPSAAAALCALCSDHNDTSRGGISAGYRKPMELLGV